MRMSGKAMVGIAFGILATLATSHRLEAAEANTPKRSQPKRVKVAPFEGCHWMQTVRPGEKLGTYSIDAYGELQYYPALSELNGITDANHIEVGWKITIPCEAPVLVASSSGQRPGVVAAKAEEILPEPIVPTIPVSEKVAKALRELQPQSEATAQATAQAGETIATQVNPPDSGKAVETKDSLVLVADQSPRRVDETIVVHGTTKGMLEKGIYAVPVARSDLGEIGTGIFPAVVLLKTGEVIRKRKKTSVMVDEAADGNYSVSVHLPQKIPVGVNSSVEFDLGKGNIQELGSDLIAEQGTLLQDKVSFTGSEKKLNYLVLNRTFRTAPTVAKSILKWVWQLGVPAAATTSIAAFGIPAIAFTGLDVYVETRIKKHHEKENAEFERLTQKDVGD